MSSPVSRECQRGVVGRVAVALNGVFTLGLLVLLFVEQGWRVGTGALAIICITASLALAGQAAIASAKPEQAHPLVGASWAEHSAWHRVQDFKRPWMWPLVGALLLAGAVLTTIWFASG